jgi:hypothetical protein
MANGKRVDLLSNAGTGNGSDFVWPGGKTAFIGEATYGGGTQKLQIKLPQATYADVTSVSLTAAGMIVTDLPPGTYRAVATTATANYVSLVKIEI